MDTRAFALENCPRCGGKQGPHPGRVKTGPGVTDWAICSCALLGQRRATAERIIEQRFPGRMRWMTFQYFHTGERAKNEQALKVARNFVDNYEKARQRGWLLGFWGKPASGKTHLAVAIAQACVKRYLARPRIWNVPKLLKAQREWFNTPDWERKQKGMNSSPLDDAMGCDLLILDDFGAQYERDENPERVSWVMEQLYTILDERFMSDRPTIVTSNLSPSELRERLSSEAGKRVLSRIERAQVIPEDLGFLEIVSVPEASRINQEDVDLLYK